MLTPEEFAARMFKELERDNWGSIEPHLFESVALGDTSIGDVAALREVLVRVLVEPPTRLAEALAAAADMQVGFCCGCETFNVALLKMAAGDPRWRVRDVQEGGRWPARQSRWSLSHCCSVARSRGRRSRLRRLFTARSARSATASLRA